MKIITKSEKETQEAGEKLVQTLAPGSVVAMYGDLGAGKTAFVRGMTRGLGINFPVSSPTFNVVNEYPGKVPLFLERGGICAVEWSENVEEAFEPGTVKVIITKLGDSEREITVEVME